MFILHITMSLTFPSRQSIHIVRNSSIPPTILRGSTVARVTGDLATLTPRPYGQRPHPLKVVIGYQNEKHEWTGQERPLTGWLHCNRKCMAV